MAARLWLLALALTLSVALVVGCASGPSSTSQPGSTTPPAGTGAATAPGKAPTVPATPAVAMDQQLGSGAVTLKGYTLQKAPDGQTLIILYWQDNQPVAGSYSALLHLFPQDASLLSSERKQYGFANMDRDPQVPTSAWQPGRTYVSIHHGTLSPGTYHGFTGLYTNTAGKISRLRPAKPAKPMKTEKDALDLGTITIP